MSLKGEAAKSANQYSIFDNVKEIKDLTSEEAIFELEQWRKIWDYVPVEMQGILAQVGQEVIIYKRDGDSFQGFLAGVNVRLTEYVFKTTERIRSQVDKKFFIYTTESKIPVSNIVDFKVVTGTFDDTEEPSYN